MPKPTPAAKPGVSATPKPGRGRGRPCAPVASCSVTQYDKIPRGFYWINLACETTAPMVTVSGVVSYLEWCWMEAHRIAKSLKVATGVVIDTTDRHVLCQTVVKGVYHIAGGDQND